MGGGGVKKCYKKKSVLSSLVFKMTFVDLSLGSMCVCVYESVCVRVHVCVCC